MTGVTGEECHVRPSGRGPTPAARVLLDNYCPPFELYRCSDNHLSYSDIRDIRGKRVTPEHVLTILNQLSRTPALG